MSSYAAGELGDEDFARVDSHVVACADCARRVQELESRSDGELKLLLRDELGDPTSFYSSRYDRLLAKLQAIQEEGTTSVLAAGAPRSWDYRELIGTRLGDFRIDRLLGQGGMGVVYEAHQLSLGRKVALKVLPRQMLARSRVKERFEREVKVVANLHHTNIVPVFGFGEQDGLFYYVMQYIAGCPLSRVIAERRECDSREEVPRRDDGTEDARWRFIARVGAQVGWALSHAHQHGVLHRDIKPSNLLLDESGVVWVADFGLAKCEQHPELTETQEVLGTLRYLPPEVLEGRADERGDIYSLGLTLYELALGRPAYGEVERYRLLRSIMSFEVERLETALPDVPRDLATIIHKSIERDPADRYTSAREFAEDLQRFLDDQPIRARRASSAERLRRWIRNNRVLATSLAATLLTLLVALSVSIGASLYFYRLEQDKAALAAKLQLSLEEEARQRQQAETITEYLETIFKPDEPIAERPDITLQEALMRATEALDPATVEDSRTRYKLFNVYGRAFYSLGNYESAIKLYEQAIVAIEPADESMTSDLLATKMALAEALTRVGKHEQGITLGQEVADALAARHGEEYLETINQRLWVALQQDDSQHLANLASRVHPLVAVAKEDVGDVGESRRWAIEQLGMAYLKLGEYEKAEFLYEGFIERARHEVDSNPQETVLTFLKAAWMFRVGGRNERAYRYGREAVEIGQQRLGESHNATLWAMDMLWRIYQETGELDRARQVADELMRRCRTKFGSEHDEVARLEARYGQLTERLAESVVGE
ncbi:MAG: protein kinase [Planctomycetales bacterium]|nr:protein kinase [Planctomycetales bacterium]